jgi:SpoVK/Ycf46/Vps4 family AAA+-type ATPase
MNGQHDLKVILRSRTPIIVIETRDEARMLEMLQTISVTSSGDNYMPLFQWTQPTDVLKHIRAVSKPGIYVLLDFHPFIEDPVHIRLIKDICIRYREIPRQLVLISHAVKLPSELESYSARFDMSLPTEEERRRIVRNVADQWVAQNPGSRVKADSKAHEMLIRNLAGLTYFDTELLARNAIFVDGAITKSDLPGVMQAKYELLNRGGALQFEYDTARFNDLGGMHRLKNWLAKRKAVFRGDDDVAHLDSPKGIVLLGVQGCGKSLAAKVTAGIFGVPLLRLDFGAIYDKYHGETERKLRESLQTADVMSPCVLWIDEIEKGIAGRGGETGTTQRVLGTFLTWMAEKQSQVFVVATANNINALPPELVRKGRFDEIFFVDLPNKENRASILAIHLTRRDQDVAKFDVEAIAAAADGFSGSEIEQAVVAALYAAHAQRKDLTTEHMLDELQLTRPLSVVMREHIAELRRWADGRTVSCD